MSQENVQPATPDVLAVFVEGFECYNRHDFDAMMEMYASDAVSDFSRVLFDEQPRTGRKEIRAFWDRLWDTSGGMSVRPSRGSRCWRRPLRCRRRVRHARQAERR